MSRSRHHAPHSCAADQRRRRRRLLLLGMIVVVAAASAFTITPVQGFLQLPTTTSNSIRLQLPTTTSNSIRHPLSIRNTSTQRRRKAAKTILSATLEKTQSPSSSFGDDEDEDDEEDDIDDLDDDEEDSTITGDGLQQIPILPSPASPSTKQRGGGGSAVNKRRNKNKPKNAAMHDPQFLRKRTADLLKVTAAPTQENSAQDPSAMDQPQQQQMISRHMKVDKKTFHFLLDAWAFSGEADAPDQALQLLQRMEELATAASSAASSSSSSTTAGTTSVATVQPDVRSYTKTINAIARSGTRHAGEQAEAVLRRLEETYQRHLRANNGDDDAALAMQPNSHTYTAVVQAHANSGAPGSAERAEARTEQMVLHLQKQQQQQQRGDSFQVVSQPQQQPTTTTTTPTAKAFNAVIHAYGKAGRAEAAERVFERMEELYRTGLFPDAKPNVVHYNALISAWANCCDRVEGSSSAVKAQQVLERMESRSTADNNSVVRPTVVSFNAVIDAYAKAGQAERAEELLRRMMTEPDLPSPNTRSFNSVLNAWAKSRHNDDESATTTAVQHAEELLDLMMKKNDSEQQKDGKNINNDVVRPDVHSFCTVINAYARSGKSDKAERAFNLYQDMKRLYKAGNKRLRPNVIAANAVLNACAYTVGDIRHQNRAVELAHKILKDLEQSPFGNPDQVTYGTFLKVCAQQMPDSHTRQQIVEVLFRKCCRDGQVGNLVLHQFQAMASPELFQDLVGRSIHEYVRMEDLPKEWWCNVVEGKWRRRRSNSN